MLENWQNWCRLCGKIDSSNEDTAYRSKATTQQLDTINHFFRTALLPLDGIEATICNECGNLLGKLNHFGEQCMKTEQMFRELMQQPSVSSTDLESIRCKYGMDEETKYSSFLIQTQDEPETQQYSRLLDQVDQPLDPLEMEFESSVVVKQELLDEDHIPLAKRQATEDNVRLKRSAVPGCTQSLYIVSYQQQKHYMVVSHYGKEPDYDDYVTAVRNKFSLQDVILYNQEEIRISRDVFKPVFEQFTPEYVIIKSNTTVPTSPVPSSSFCNAISSSFDKPPSQGLNWQQVVPILKEHFCNQTNNLINGVRLLERKTLNDRERKLVIRIVCDHLHLCCPTPKKEDKVAWAEATIALFPCLKVDNPQMPYEAVYNPNNRGGFLGHRIKNISKTLSDRTSTEQNSDDENEVVEEPNRELYRDILKTLNPQSDREIIIQYMDLTFDMRKKLIATPEKNRMTMDFPRFLDTVGLVQMEFERYHPGKGDKLKELLTDRFVNKLMVLSRKSALTDDVNEWPEIVRAVIGWLTLLKPTGCKSPRTVKGALDELIQHQLTLYPLFKTHPYIVAVGNDKSSIVKYYIQVNGRHIITTDEFIDALDVWFKAHIVFNLTHEHSLSNFFIYLKAYVFKIPILGVPTTVSKCCLLLNQE